MFGKKKDEKYYLTHMTDEEIAAATKKMEENIAQKKEYNKARGLRGRFSDAMEAGMAANAETIRRKYYPRWRKVCGVETDEEIDFTNPVVSVESKICDPRVQRQLIQGKRAEFLATLTETEQ